MDDERMLSRLIRALMTYYGPMCMIRATIHEADKVIEEMAVAGHIKEAKTFADVLNEVRNAVSVSHT